MYMFCLSFWQRSAREDDKVPGLMRKLDAVCELRAKVQEACDCSFLYWHKVGSDETIYDFSQIPCIMHYILHLTFCCIGGVGSSVLQLHL